MKHHGWQFLILLVVAALITAAPVAADTTSVALTTTTRSEQPRKQIEAFVDLLESELSQIDSIEMVERRRLEMSLQELILSQSLSRQQRDALQLGKLHAADLILNAQAVSHGKSSNKESVVIRIVDAKSGVICGQTTALFDDLSIVESAASIAQYLVDVIESPSEAAITVAVGAFESAGRFVRLRPLELGIRDMLTDDLVRISRFRVLQRSNMQDLLREMSLIEGGFNDPATLPDSLPQRSAAYLVSGTIDEENSDGQLRVRVAGSITRAGADQPIHKFEFLTEPSGLPQALEDVALKMTRVVSGKAELAPPRRDTVESNETRYLFDQVLHDLYRFRMVSPSSGGNYSFRIRGIDLRKTVDSEAPKYASRGYWVTSVYADTQLGTHLLKKSIDRLESILFIEPDNAIAAYCLAFCFSHHIDGIVDHQRAVELLYQVYHSDPPDASDGTWKVTLSDGRRFVVARDDLVSLAMHLLAAIGRHHRSGISRRVAPELNRMSTENVMFAFTNMPLSHCTYRWSRLLYLFRRQYLEPQYLQSLMPILRVIAKRIDQVENAMVKRRLATEASRIAAYIPQPEAEALMASWSDSDNKWQRHAGCLYFAEQAESKRDYMNVAKWMKQAAQGYRGSDEYADRQAFENLLTEAAEYLRRSGQVEQALALLDTFSPSEPRSRNRGNYDFERGHCLELMGKTQEALELFVTAAESVPHLINSASVSRAIREAGGVPLRKDREIDVRYASDGDNGPDYCQAIATDGQKIFCSGRERTGFQIYEYDPAVDAWTTIRDTVGRVTCMGFASGSLWVGTDKDGLLRYDTGTGSWHVWNTQNGLPDLHVESLSAVGGDCYVGVGTSRGGGLVKVEQAGTIHVFEGANAPDQAPTHIIVNDDRITTRTIKSVLEFNRKTQTWHVHELFSLKSPLLFAGTSGLWASTSHRELYPIGRSNIAEDKFKDAWYPYGRGKSGYTVKFLIEGEDDIWFGGTAYENFLCNGLYRVNKHTGEFTMFGPRDGFKMDKYYVVYGGVGIADRLWLATHGGLVEVTLRNE